MNKTLLALTLLILPATRHLCAQIEGTPSPTGSPAEMTLPYEELPELKASEILRPEILNGPHHKVREEVSTYFGANHYVIDSEFGVFEADGNEMLVRRVNEINAIAKLKDVSKTDQYKSALAAAAKAPVAAAKSIVTDPVNTVKSVPKGIMKFMGRAGESIKGMGKKASSDSIDGSTARDVIGFTGTKRKVAVSLGVDPYSSNAVLQKELDGIAWAAFAGGATFQLATLPIGGGVGAALTVTNVAGSLEDMLATKDPSDLKIMNRKSLLGMGAGSGAVESFLNNGAFSPTAQTAFTLNLKALDGVANRGAFVKIAAENSSSEADAIFCVQTAALLARLHKNEMPLARITPINNFPTCVAKDGTVVAAMQWDYAAFTARADNFAKLLQAQAKPPATCFVALSGVASPHLRQELESRGFRVEDRLSPGPLR
jgi:hypothetical protein